MRFRVQVFLLLLLSSATANLRAQVVALDPLIQGAPLGEYLSLWVDEVGDADIQKVIRQAYWLPVTEAIPNYGVSQNVFWFRLQIQNVQHLENWLLEVSNPLLDQLDVFVVADDSRILTEEKLGMARAMSARSLMHRLYLVPLNVPAETHFTVYLKIASHHSIQLPISLWPTDGFIDHSESGSILVGMLAGALAIMLLYNFFLYTAIRDPIYLVYVCGVCSFLVLQISLKGLGTRFLWNDSSQWAQLAVYSSAYSALFFATTFSIWFLRLKQRGFRLLWAVNLVRVGAVAALLLMPLIDRYWDLYIIAVLSLSVIGIGFIAVFSFYKSGDRPIKIFASAWIVFLLGVILYLLNKLGMISVNVWTEQTLSLGMIIEMILFSIALGDRINSEKAQALAARNKLLQSLQAEQDETQRLLQIEEMELKAKELSLQFQLQNNAQLEKDIEERTFELRKATETLSELVRLDPLTQVYNRHYFNEQINEQLEAAKRSGSTLSLMVIDVDHFKSVNDRWGHAAGDKCLCVVAATIAQWLNTAEGSLFRFGGEEFVVLMPDTEPKQACLLAETIRTRISELTFEVQNGPNHLSVSVGVAGVVPGHRQRPEQLIEMADAALYRAKQKGRNRVELADTNGGQLRA